MARKAAGFNQRELAAMCNLSAMAISKYERDLMMPQSSALISISKALQVGIEFLLICVVIVYRFLACIGPF